MWIRIALPYAVFGIKVEGGVVVDAAPIARWTVGKSERYVADHYRCRGATFLRVAQ